VLSTRLLLHLNDGRIRKETAA
jgi:hypothetical protein